VLRLRSDTRPPGAPRACQFLWQGQERVHPRRRPTLPGRRVWITRRRCPAAATA